MRLQYSGVGKIADGAGGTITNQEFSLILVVKYMLLLHSDSTFLRVEREGETMWGPSFHFKCTHLMFLICLPLTFLWPKFWYLVSGWLSKVVCTWTVMSSAKTWMYHSEDRMGEWRVGSCLQSWSTTPLPSQPACKHKSSDSCSRALSSTKTFFQTVSSCLNSEEFITNPIPPILDGVLA